MSPDTVEELSVLVRTGFYSKDRLIEIFCEEMYAPGELDSTKVSAALDEEISRFRAEQSHWPPITDCDRLDKAFTALESRGIIALQNAGYTQSDGHGDFAELYQRARNKNSIVGYCFYHGQDLERAVRGGGLYLAFGPPNPNDESTKGAEIGRIIENELTKVGLVVAWNVTFNQRIQIPKFEWRRRFTDF